MFTLSVNELSIPIKIQIGRMDKTKNMVQKYVTHKSLTSNTTLIDKRIEKDIPCKHQSTQRQRIAPLISDKVLAKAKKIIRQKEEYFNRNTVI